MHSRRLLAFASALALAACSSTSASPPAPTGASGSPCTTTDQCDWDRCTCVHGAQDIPPTCISGVCTTDSASVCPKGCATAGGLVSVAPAPNLVGSPECDALCNKVATCPGARCNPYYYCSIGTDQSESCTRAFLACQVQTEMFTCPPGENGTWSFTDVGCEAQVMQCDVDAGK